MEESEEGKKSVLFSGHRGKELQANLVEVAQQDVPGLIRGGNKADQVTVARFIHEHSRSGQPFVIVNCENLPAESQAAELFGQHGASGDCPGKVQFAQGGTLFLLGLCQLTLAVQGALIQTLSQGMLLGPDGKETPVDFRVIATVEGEDEQSTGLHPGWIEELGAMEVSLNV